MLLPLDRAEALAHGVGVEEPRIDDDLAADLHAPLFQKKSERIARVEVDGVELHEAAAAEEERRVDGDLAAPPDEREEHRRRKVVGGEDEIAHAPEARAVRHAQSPP